MLIDGLVMPSHPIQFASIDDELVTVTGGAQKSQAELRQMAQQYCPQTYQRFRNAGEITRPMAQKCLDEAGYGWASSQLDQYFPRKR